MSKTTRHIEDIRIELANVLTMPNYKARRTAVRKLAYEVLTAITNDYWIKRVFEKSPLIGTSSDQVNPRPTIAGLRDTLAEVPLVNIAAGYPDPSTALLRVRDALETPAHKGVTSEASRTGWAFGENLHHEAVKDLKDWLPRPTHTPEPAPKRRKADTTTTTTHTKGTTTMDGSHTTESEAKYRLMLADMRLDEIVDAVFRTHFTTGYTVTGVLGALKHGAYRDTDKARAVAVETYMKGMNAADVPMGLEEMRPEESISVDTVELVDALTALLPSGGKDKDVKAMSDRKADLVIVDEVEGFKLPEGSRRELVDLALERSGLPNIEKLLGSITFAHEAKARAEEELEELRKRPAVSSAPIALEIEAKRGTPAGKVVLKPAHEVFGLERGKDVFSFDVPTWEWEHEHPIVPAVDPNYIFRPHELFSMLYGIVKNRPTYLHGHTGTGKTTLVQQVAARMQWPFMRLNFDSDISRMDLIGRDTLVEEDGTTVSRFADGIVPQMMQGPHIACFDEIDFCRPDIAYVMQRVFENDALVITEDGGRVVKPHPMYRMFATGNTVGQGDEHGMYQGARPQSMALLDRFTNWIEVHYLEHDQRMQLIKAAAPGLDDRTVRQIGSYVAEHLEAFRQSNVLQPISPRGYMALAEAVATYLAYYPDSKRKMAMDLAVASVVLNRASEQDKAVLRGIVDRVFS